MTSIISDGMFSHLMPQPEEQLKELLETVSASESVLPELKRLLPAFETCLRDGNKILACGNGGSATDSMHLVEELVGRYRGDRRSLPAVSLNGDASVMSCIANDWDFDHVYCRQVEGLGRRGDMLVAFTTSGNSTNIFKALETAKAGGLITVAFMGKDGGRCKGIADFEIIIPSKNTARIQEMHTWLLHVMLEYVEECFN
ncbi:MAG: SIS domain-containing protein [Verrucomicrobiota bacterium]